MMPSRSISSAPSRTAAGLWQDGARLNLERSLKIGDELGGHLVTGHVDGVAEIVARESVVKAAGLAAGLRRALAPETRNRIRFEVRQETRRAGRERRAETKQALREFRARERAASRAVRDVGEDVA